MKEIIVYILFAVALFSSLALLQNFAKNIIALFSALTKIEMIEERNDMFDGLLMKRPLTILVVLLWTALLILTNIQ